MGENFNYREELNNVRKNVEGLERNGEPATLEAYWEVCCGDVLVAEENFKNQDKEWENASLAQELLDIAKYLEDYDFMIDHLYSAVSRMIKTISDHPRLTLKMLELKLQILYCIEAQCDHDLNESDDVQEEIFFYRRNIDRADNGDFEHIEQTGHLKRDPIEWSADYENSIDEANKKIHSLLEKYPRGMGFCFAYWQTKKQILHENYGIEWKSPAIMNPKVLFD